MQKRGVIWLSVLVALALLLGPRTEAVVRPTLYWGSRGESVKLVQWKLNSWGYYKGKVDGIFGKKTYDAVVYFQRKNGLKVDGIVGKETWAAIGLPSTGSTAAAPGGGGGGGGGSAGGGGGSAKGGGGGTAKGGQGGTGGVARDNDVYLLAQMIYAEAKGEPYEGQVAVGAVILNRIKDSKFPDTLRGVIYEPRAFEPVQNGSLYNAPDASAKKAAQDALNGWDPTYGCLYFWNPAKVSPTSWVWSRKVVRRIGEHVFAK